MKITVDLSESCIDYDEKDGCSIEEAIKDGIRHDVIRQIRNELSEKAQKEIKEAVQKELESTLKSTINNEVYRLIGEGFLEDRQSPDGMITIKDYVKRLFMKDSGWGNPANTLEKLAREFGMELKKRYDLMFASNIVSALKEQGMLKDDMLTKLLEKQ